MTLRPLLAGISIAALALLLSCGGGGSSAGAVSATVLGGNGSLVVNSGGDGSASGSPATGAANGGAGTSASGGSTSGGSTPGDSTSGDSGSSGGATGVASSGGDGSGVGSGGTGIGVGDSSSVGSVSGLGSIILNGVRYNVDSAVTRLPDGEPLQIGMSVEVTGAIDNTLVNGVAHQLTSAIDLRGPVTGIDLAGGSFDLLGTTVVVADSTVFGDVSGLGSLQVGSSVRVWGLPGDSGVVNATRVELGSAGDAAIVSGALQQLDVGTGTFRLGTLSVAYGAANFAGGLSQSALANGVIVRVRASGQPVAGLLTASQVEAWYPIPTATGTPVRLEGPITSFSGIGGFRVLATNVDASAATITGGRASAVGPDVVVQVTGVLQNGVLVATDLKIEHVPGGASLPSYTLIGSIGNFSSPASFRVRGQLVDASAPGVVFLNGSAANLGNGVSVTVLGTQVVNGVLLANQLSFN